MRTPEQAKWDFVQQWLNKAHNDLKAASFLLGSDLKDYESVGFHAQQAAEKFTKSFLVRHQVEFPKTHDIARLRHLVAKVDSGLAESFAPADELTPYGVEFRYPGDLQPLSIDHAAHAIRLAKQLRDLIMVNLKPYLDEGRP